MWGIVKCVILFFNLFKDDTKLCNIIQKILGRFENKFLFNISCGIAMKYDQNFMPINIYHLIASGKKNRLFITVNNVIIVNLIAFGRGNHWNILSI